MKRNIARQPAGVIAATFALITALSVARSLLAPYPAETITRADMPLSLFIDNLADGIFGRYAAAVVILCLNALLLTRIMIIYKASFGRSFLPFVMYSAAATGILFPSGSIAIPLAALLLGASCEQAVAAFRRRYRFEAVFNSAFLLGIVPLLYAPAVCLLPILALTLSIYKRTAREVAVSLAGLLTPWLLCSAAWWIAGCSWSHVSSELLTALLTTSGSIPLAELWGGNILPVAVFAGIYLAVIVASVVLMVGRLGSYSIRVRKVYIHFAVLLLLCAAIFFLPSSDPVASVALVAVPATILGTHLFVRLPSSAGIPVYILLLLSFAVANMGGLPL